MTRQTIPPISTTSPPAATVTPPEPGMTWSQGFGTPKAPAIVSLLGSAAPAVKIGGGGGVIGGPAAIGTGSAGFSNLDYDSRKPVSNAVGTISVGSVFAGPISDLVPQRWISRNRKRSAACFPSSNLLAVGVPRVTNPLDSATAPSATGLLPKVQSRGFIAECKSSVDKPACRRPPRWRKLRSPVRRGLATRPCACHAARSSVALLCRLFTTSGDVVGFAVPLNGKNRRLD